MTWHWHKNGWEVRFDYPIREPRCRCERCELRLTILARQAAARLLQIKGES